MREESETEYPEGFFTVLAAVSTLVGLVVAAVVACFF